MAGSDGAAALWLPERRRRRPDAAAEAVARRRQIRRRHGVPACICRRGGRRDDGRASCMVRFDRGGAERRWRASAAAAICSVAGEGGGRGRCDVVLHGGPPSFAELQNNPLRGGFRKYYVPKFVREGKPVPPAGDRATWRVPIGRRPAALWRRCSACCGEGVAVFWPSDRAIGRPRIAGDVEDRLERGLPRGFI